MDAVEALCQLHALPSDHEIAELEEREEIAQLAEAAGIRTCKLELEDYLMLEKWFARTGSYMMPCSSCVAAREPSVAISTKSSFVGSGTQNASNLDQDGLGPKCSEATS